MGTSINTPEITQKPPTKVFILRVGRIRYYNITVEAESAEQAQKAWEEDGGEEGLAFEYGARHQPEYEWEEGEFLEGVSNSNSPVENAEVEYNQVRSALGLESLEKEEE
jgi:hypothetical protein